MNQRHTYAYEVEQAADSGPARVVRLVGQNKRVLEVGSGPGSITRLLTSVSHCRVTALDFDAQAIALIAPHCERAVQADLNQNDWPRVLGEGATFDVVVAADVLEHVYQPQAVLASMAQLLNEEGHIVLSLPHAAHAVVHACLLDEDFEYGDFGLLDRTHIRFFGLKNMQRLVADAGLKIEHAELVVRAPQSTEFAYRWAQLTPAVRAALETNPFGHVYQVILKAVPLARPGASVELMAMQVLARPPGLRDHVRATLRRLLPTGVYSRLRSIAAKLGAAYKA